MFDPCLSRYLATPIRCSLMGVNSSMSQSRQIYGDLICTFTGKPTLRADASTPCSPSMRYLLTIVMLMFSLQSADASAIQQGQVWSYQARPGENDCTLTVLKIEQYKDLGQVVHVRIDGIRIRNPIKGNIVTSIPHLPFRRAAIQRSVRKLLRKASFVPNFKEGYDVWRKAHDEGKAGAFDTDVAVTLTALLGADWEEKK